MKTIKKFSEVKVGDTANLYGFEKVLIAAKGSYDSLNVLHPLIVGQCSTTKKELQDMGCDLNEMVIVEQTYSGEKESILCVYGEDGAFVEKEINENQDFYITSSVMCNETKTCYAVETIFNGKNYTTSSDAPLTNEVVISENRKEALEAHHKMMTIIVIANQGE